MRAVGYKISGPIDAIASLVDINLPEPSPTGRDILVEVKAVSVNPVDYKVRRSTPPTGIRPPLRSSLRPEPRSTSPPRLPSKASSAASGWKRPG